MTSAKHNDIIRKREYINTSEMTSAKNRPKTFSVDTGLIPTQNIDTALTSLTRHNTLSYALDTIPDTLHTHLTPLTPCICT